MANGGRQGAGGLPAGQRASDVANGAVIVAAAATAAAVIAYPFTLAKYPPLTDLPFHAAQASIFRHYLDPAFHFREQFSLHPLEVPYVSMYALGAFFALFVSISAATKLMAITMLALVPGGLAVLFHGMKKSPLWGLSGLVLTWCTVTQWGFLNFMGAFGLFAASIGLALLVVDEPTRGRQVGLGLTLVAIFFTHVYRLPFAFVGVLLAGGFVFPSTRRFTVLLRPMLPALLLFALWLVIRPRGMGISGHLVGFHPERWSDLGRHLFGSYLPIDGSPPTPEGTLERALAKRTLAVTLFTMVAAALYGAVNGQTRRLTDDERRFRRSVTALVLTISCGLLLAYFVLPLEAGRWFYIYPREIVGAALMALALAPDLPRALAPRLGFVGLIAAASLPMSGFVSDRFREFDTVTADFRAVVDDIPQAPRLFYLVYWLGDSAKRATPFLHLPAWVQAEKGGALDFHFVSWNLYPIRYRQGSPDVPPPTPPRFEWTPQYFDVKKHGAWFDTFLVRHREDPQSLFDPDPTIHLVSHRGTWWLYRRARPTR